MKRHYFLITIFSIVIFIQAAFSSPPPNISNGIDGFVTDSKTGETLIGATVLITGTKKGAYTNKNGYFTITDIQPGQYEVRITSIGYQPKVINIKLLKDKPKRLNIELVPTSIKTDEIFVEAAKEIEKRQITVSKVDIPVKQLREIRIGGESDIFRSLQYLPGVLTSSQISSGLYIRGGSPDQNLVLLDGATVYNPSHIFGFISTFNSNAIKDVELIKGGFPAEYGNRLSAVLDITQKDGNKEKVEGIASIGALSSQLTVEGPIPTLNATWFVSGRRTYLELIKSFFPEDPESPLPNFNFFDLNGKLTFNLGANDRLFVSGFGSGDNLGYDATGLNMNLSIGNVLGSMKWNHIFNHELFSTVLVSASKYFNEFKGDNSGYSFLINNDIIDYTGKVSLEWHNSDYLTTKFGFEGTWFTFGILQNFTGDTDSTAKGSQGGSVNLKIHDINLSTYQQINYMATDLLSLQAGLRWNYWDESNFFSVDPRLAVRFQFTDDYALKFSWGIYHQSLRLASLQDFSFFDTWMPTDTSVPASRAYHYIAAFETKPADGYEFNFDVYYKDLRNISEINQNAIEGKTVSDVFFIGNGKAYGAELFLKKSYGDFTGWVGYGLGWISARFDSINGGEEFRPKYDRRHDFKLVLHYKLNETWEFGATFLLQSGQSYTGATSRFQSRLPSQNYGRGKIYPTKRYAFRLPLSHQLNLSASWHHRILGAKARLMLDIFNVYNHRDIWFRYYNVQNAKSAVEDITLLPILPTLSYEVKF